MPGMNKDGLLKDFMQISDLIDQHGLTADFFSDEEKKKEVLSSIGKISETLKISNMQAVLLALLLNCMKSDGATLKDIAKAAKVQNLQALDYLDDLEALEKKRLIVAHSEYWNMPTFIRKRGHVNGYTYMVPLDVLKAIRAGTPFRYAPYDNLRPSAFFEAAGSLLKTFREDGVSLPVFMSEIKSLFSANPRIAFVKGVKAQSLPPRVSMPLLAFCCTLIEDDRDSLPVKSFRHLLFGSNGEERFNYGSHPLIEKGFLENDCDRGIADTERYRLTEKAKEIFLADVDPHENSTHGGKDIIPAKSITARELFYSGKLLRRINELSKLLREEHFAPVKKRLAEQNMRSGFTCLFSGSPGTGKTETAYQIARETGRDIYLVDIAETKSMWFGESEKRIKAVFDRYRSMIKNRSITPILLFNEADAVLGRRQELGDQRRGPAQTENAIQNIILQAMENLDGGILIATTNMTCNLDTAFERRFLYKIEFEKPDIQAKIAIWQNYLSGLSSGDAEALSRRFDFSGGQIENIARKQTVSTLLSGEPLCIDEVISLCEDETIEKGTKRIGFCA
jgi:hypothetical protein